MWLLYFISYTLENSYTKGFSIQMCISRYFYIAPPPLILWAPNTFECIAIAACLLLMYQIIANLFFTFIAGQNVCLLPAMVGRCEGYFPKWFYNSMSARCEQFIYGGCEGNPNKFDSRKSCEDTCVCGKLHHCRIHLLPLDDWNIIYNRSRFVYASARNWTL